MRVARKPLAVSVVTVMLGLAVGCSSDPVSPAAPAPPPPAPAPPPPPPPLAVLVIEDLFVAVRSNNRATWLEPRFRLRETGGKSGATIRQVDVVDRNGGGASTGGNCLQGMRVPPGGTVDTFYTDEGWDWLSYCAPSVNDPVRVVVQFADDEGRTATVDATIVQP